MASKKDSNSLGSEQEKSQNEDSSLLEFKNSDNKKEILLESILLKFKNLAAVIVIPALLTPGINANIWNKPINKTDLIFKSVEIFRSVFLWSAKKSMNPKNNVVDAIIFVFLKRWINSVVYKIYPNIIKGKEPIIIKFNN